MKLLTLLAAIFCVACAWGAAAEISGDSPAEETPAYPFPWMPLVVGDVTIVSWDGFSYVDTTGRTYWSGAAQATAADATDAVTTPRTPPAPVPTRVTRRQLLLALFSGHAITRANIRAALEAIPDATQREAALIEFDEATEFERSHALIGQLAAVFSLSSSQVDAVFRAAVNL